MKIRRKVWKKRVKPKYGEMEYQVVTEEEALCILHDQTRKAMMNRLEHPPAYLLQIVNRWPHMIKCINDPNILRYMSKWQLCDALKKRIEQQLFIVS